MQILSGFLALLSVSFLALSCSPDEGPLELPLLVISGPRTIYSFEVREPEGELLWRIESPTGGPLTGLFYGRIPPGFKQVFPLDAATPRPFLYGESITTETISEDRRFIHYGVADGSRELALLSSEMSLLRVLTEEERQLRDASLEGSTPAVTAAPGATEAP
jgi:hypothetical protein